MVILYVVTDKICVLKTCFDEVKFIGFVSFGGMYFLTQPIGFSSYVLFFILLYLRLWPIVIFCRRYNSYLVEGMKVFLLLEQVRSVSIIIRPVTLDSLFELSIPPNLKML